MIRLDKCRIDGKTVITKEGYLRADAIVTRSGIFYYRNMDGSIRKEWRPQEEVFNSDSLATLKEIPVTNNHPAAQVITAQNAKALSVGYTSETIAKEDEHFVKTKFTVTDVETVKEIENGKQELSLGYTVRMDMESGETPEGEKYDCIQRDIQYNHLAIVESARAGKRARIHIDGTELTPEEIEQIKKDEQKQNPKPKKGDNTMDKMIVDGIAYEAAPQVINYAKKQDEKIVALGTDNKVALDKLQAKLDTAEEKIKKIPTDDQRKDGITTAVKVRVGLVQNAERVLKKDALKELDSMSNKDIQLAIIKEINSKADMTDKSDTYIEARYDSVVEDLPKNKIDGKKIDFKKNDGDEDDQATKARKRYVDELEKKHKPKVEKED